MALDGLEYEDGKWIIDVDSEAGLFLAIENFIYNCSEHIIPKNCDREQLVQNIEAMRDLEKRKLWLKKGFGIEKDETEIEDSNDVQP